MFRRFRCAVTVSPESGSFFTAFAYVPLWKGAQAKTDERVLLGSLVSGVSPFTGTVTQRLWDGAGAWATPAARASSFG
jgi:hypothetical protein